MFNCGKLDKKSCRNEQRKEIYVLVVSVCILKSFCAFRGSNFFVVNRTRNAKRVKCKLLNRTLGIFLNFLTQF